MKHLVMAMAVLASFGIAAEASSEAAANKEKKAPDPSKRVCKSTRPTGSRVADIVCHTNAEWQAIDTEQSKVTGEMLRSRDAATVVR